MTYLFSEAHTLVHRRAVSHAIIFGAKTNRRAALVDTGAIYSIPVAFVIMQAMFEYKSCPHWIARWIEMSYNRPRTVPEQFDWHVHSVFDAKIVLCLICSRLQLKWQSHFNYARADSYATRRAEQF